VARNPASSVPDDPLRQSVRFLPGVTPERYDQLERLGIRTIEDLLYHFPRTYEDLSDVRPIGKLTEGSVQTVRGEVVEIGGREVSHGRTVTSVVLSDGRHCLEGAWFNQPYMGQRFRYGQRVAFSGKPKWFRDHWQMTNPRVQYLDGSDEGQSKVVPVYPLTEDLKPGMLLRLIRRAVDLAAHQLDEPLPAELRRRHGLPIVHLAMHDVHFPESLDAARAARRRFVYEDFLVLQLGLALRRRELRDRQRAPVLKTTPAIDARIRRLFPFRLTGDQDRAVAEIAHDLASDRPMQRLLQADVGAGKTAVAVYALLVAVANQHQAALMAPTEVLARQHYQTLEKYLAHSRVRRLLLTGGLSSKERQQALDAIRAGHIDLVVGTQALVQEDVQFWRLGLVVIDEQHKFGVSQRARIRKLGIDPHYLVMTATPIPRTVALTVFGDLDTSTIRELPPGRLPVTTRWLRADQRDRLYERLRAELRAGRQAYVVCPLVEEAEDSASPGADATPLTTAPAGHGAPRPAAAVKAAEQTYEELRTGPFRDFRLGLLHGRMTDEAKDAVMRRFRDHELDLLVTTVVIEVGVDVPNATLMVVEQAERFGLSQLHQLRGRISRGQVAGQCYLFADPATDEAQERLRAITRTRDGFALAELDARLRGVGEFFGTRQHGLGELRVADLLADRDLLQLARKDAIALVAHDPGLRQPEHELLRRKVLERYGRTLELAEVG
jgi:ATP-dependent DNA helicase RecG